MKFKPPLQTLYSKPRTLAHLLQTCISNQTHHLHLHPIHAQSIVSGLRADLFLNNLLLNAMLIFGELPVRNSVTWTAVITGYSQIGESDVSLKLFNLMKDEGVWPDRFVLSSAISACSALGFLEGGRQIHGFAYRVAAEMDVSVNNVLIDLVHANSFDNEAMALFLEMSRLGWRPDGFACTSILSSCGSLMTLQQGRQIHGYAIKANLEFDEYVKNGLIDMYAKCSSLTEARVLFDVLAEDSVISYNAMIEGYASHEELVEAFVLFNIMRSRLLPPTLLTFVSLLGASASASAVDLSKQIHGLIIKEGISLDLYAVIHQWHILYLMDMVPGRNEDQHAKPLFKLRFGSADSCPFEWNLDELLENDIGIFEFGLHSHKDERTL
uniref:Pentatricopeptide repeat-containing protein n=1 Tax=Ananas comosus var. bracteatus TaxID=296719 RepID=A0A6V7QWC3_ANACO